MSNVTLHLGDCMDVMRGMEANSVDAIVTDPPYFKVKGEAWDRQWDTAGNFIAWVGELCEQWQRILKPNGSLYVFASPQMRARVEVEVGRWFKCLPTITWIKNDGDVENSGGKWRQACKESLRSYFPRTEAIIFAEHFNADNIAKGEAGYQAKCDELRGFVFEPLRAYLAGECERAGVTRQQVDREWQLWKNSPKGGMAGHWLSRVQWALPTRENYEWLRGVLAKLNHGGEYLRREYEDLRREYEDLRREYEDLRRPFSVTADVPYTDVWTFPTVNAYPGKHPCEKPVEMMEHIINASTRPDAVVLDCFAGSGSTGVACIRKGRRFIGIEKDERYMQQCRERLEKEAGHLFAEVA